MDRANSRADLHVHSKYSDRPAEWFLRRIGAPECFVEPLHVYQRAKEQGMDFVTIADHNSIGGALDIAHLPGTFVSDEVTTYFPEDGCKIHCLVFGISEEQFGMIQELRPSIYDLQRYLASEEILHSVSHPLFSVNQRLTLDHVEKLLLLFKRFEAVNGSRHPRAAAFVKTVFGQLTPAMIARMADRHGIEPSGPEPWEKWFTGGSDDHSGVYAASAHTVTPPATSVDEFLAHLRHGRHEPGGVCGGSLVLGHSLCHIAYGYYKSRFMQNGASATSILGELLGHLLETAAPRKSRRFSRWIPGFALDLMKRRRLSRIGPTERELVAELSALFQEGAARDASQPSDVARRVFLRLSKIAQGLGCQFVGKFGECFREGRLIDGLQTVASLGPVVLGIAPFLTAFATLHRDGPLLDSLAAHFPAARDLLRPGHRKAWITDTLFDVNGVAGMVRALGMEAKKSRREMTVVTSLTQTPATEIDLANFSPVGHFRLPEYESQVVCFPPFMEVIEYLERQEFGRLIISTPGPLGLTALAAGRLLRTPMTGVYHTDFPLLVRHLTHDHFLEELTWKYMHWFYAQMDDIGVPSEYYRNHLIENGFEAAKLWVIPHGVDLERFNPAHRDVGFWKSFGLKQQFTFLYVGRVSRDKNLELLLESFRRVRAQMPAVNLAVVGDGPSLASLRARHASPNVTFTGFLRGEELAAAFASSDALVFPSKTDTFGNVVLEAQASGLPVIVSDWGGPPEVVQSHDSGIIVDVDQPGALSDAMERLARDPQLKAVLRERALHNASERSWSHALAEIWDREPGGDQPAHTQRPRRASASGVTELIALDVA